MSTHAISRPKGPPTVGSTDLLRVIVVLCVVAVVDGCSSNVRKPRDASEIKNVQVAGAILSYSTGREIKYDVTFEDQAEIASLLDCFPNYLEHTQRGTYAMGWFTLGTLTIRYKNGTHDVVRTDYRYWADRRTEAYGFVTSPIAEVMSARFQKADIAQRDHIVAEIASQVARAESVRQPSESSTKR